jgi:hypothetical protein
LRTSLVRLRLIGGGPALQHRGARLIGSHLEIALV